MTEPTDPDRATGEPPEREYIERTIELAAAAVNAGNTPFGALLVVDGTIVREAANETRTEDDITAHPELLLARWAAQNLSAAERDRCTMYASTEPCPMCSTAIHYAGLNRVVFGVAGKTLNEVSDGVVTIPCAEVIRRGGGETTVDGPIATESAMALHRSFYADE